MRVRGLGGGGWGERTFILAGFMCSGDEGEEALGEHER